MIRVLVVSAEPRLVNAIRDNLDGEADVHVVKSADAAQTELFQHSYGLVCIDYQAVKGSPLETFITIDNVLQKERSAAALLVRSRSAEAEELKSRLDSIPAVIDLSLGRPQFDDKIRLLYSKAKDQTRSSADDPSISTDRLVRHEVDLPALANGSLVEFPLARVLYTIRQRKESGVLTLKYAGHSLKFGFVNGELSTSPDFEPPKELLGAFSWSHGSYQFVPDDVSGETTSIIQLIAEGCRDHIRQRGITELMTPVMRRYPIKTNLWEERRNQLDDYDILQQVMELVDGNTNWENALSELGQKVTDGFRAAYFAIQLDLVHTVDKAGLEGAAVQYSREVRRARAAVDQAEVEKTKAFQARTGSGRSKLEKELSVRLKQMKEATPHQLFDVWEGCGRKVVQERFYVLVKEHHPDVYGGNTSGDVRSLAQDIFILVKDTYQELLGIEKEQTVPPPGEGASAGEATKTRQTPGRKRQDTPRIDASANVGKATQDNGDAEPDVDVKSKLAKLSGFRKKQRHRERLRSRHSSSSGANEESEAEEEETRATAPEPEPEPEPQLSEEEIAKRERQAKLDNLLKRAQSVSNPDGPNPAREFWNKGYHAFKEGKRHEAFEHFQKAYELDPEDGAILTFYAYTRFIEVPNTAEQAEELLQKALQSGDRQSAPDACLFMGHVIKAQGRMEDAMKFYQRALKLNPASREAEREIRLAEKRGVRRQSDPGNFIKNLFKK